MDAALRNYLNYNMYYINELCRICLRNESSLIDITKHDTESDPLINKLKLCVSEVEWPTNGSVLMCPVCVRNLNLAYDFKTQCLQASKLFENYIEELKELRNGNEHVEDYISRQKELEQLFHSVKSNPKFYPNPFYLNTMPPKTPTNDLNQNMFVNINSTLLPIVSPTTEAKSSMLLLRSQDDSLSSLLTNRTEELSVEIDPMCFDYVPVEDESKTPTETSREWVEPELSAGAVDTFPSIPVVPEKVERTFVPIRPKKTYPMGSVISHSLPELDFLNVDHFMADKGQGKMVDCERCGQICDTIKSLYAHIRQVHSGEFPYRCRHCSTVYALQNQYETHMKRHESHKSKVFSKDTITLEDLSVHNEAELFPSSVEAPGGTADASDDDGGEPNLNLEFKCDICPRSFHNSHNLSRHKFKRHQPQRRKYFVKGMKNAKCDICNREFSTQSYLQLHIKLHFRKNDYRLKVFNKDKYATTDKQEQAEEPEAEDETKSNCDKTMEEPIEETVEEDSKTTQGQGLKIKINLRNLKNSQEVKEEKSEEELAEPEPEVKETSMEVDDEVVGELQESESKLHADSCEKEDGDETVMDCEQEIWGDGDDTVKGEALPQIPPPPIKTELVNGKQQCVFCLKLYRRKHDLKRHLNNIHLKAIQYVCHLCQTPFYEAFQLTRHLRQHNGFVRCGTCLKEYSIIRDLKLHITAAHDNDAFSQCGSCGLSFQRIRHLREHMHEHDKTIVYKCHLCPEEFKESRDLSRHLVEHSGMYACNICHTTFAAEQELTNHSKCHSDDPANERKYTCELCPSKFKKKRYLMAHIRKTHSSKNLEAINTTLEVDTKSA